MSIANRSLIAAAALAVISFSAQAQFPSLKSLPGLGGDKSSSASADPSGQNDALVRGYVGANKEVLLANSVMAEALGLKEAAAASKATAEALTEGATKGNLEDSDKAVSASTDAVAAELARSPKLDAASKSLFQKGMVQFAKGVVLYTKLRKPAQEFSTTVKSASPMMLPKLQSGAWVVSQLPGAISNGTTSVKNLIAFSKSNDIPVPADATSALSAL